MRIFKAVAVMAVTALVIFFMANTARDLRAPVEVSGTLPEFATVYDSIVLRGQVAELDRRELLPPEPSRVTACYVFVGQQVQAGQVLMELETLTAPADARAAIYSDIEAAVAGIVENGLSGEGDYQKQGSELAAAVASAAVQTGGESGLFYQIISPISGVVMEVAAEGTALSGILPCAVVSDMGKLAVNAQVSEELVSLIEQGMRCEVSIGALGAEGIGGQIETIMPYARQTGGLTQAQQTKTQVIIALESGGCELRPGYSAVAKILTNFTENAVMVPFEAIGQDGQNREYVMVLSDGRAVKRYVVTGREMDSHAEVISGLGADEMVIISPEKLTHGQRVILK